MVDEESYYCNVVIYTFTGGCEVDVRIDSDSDIFCVCVELPRVVLPLTTEEGSALHRILPRTLERIAQGNPSNDRMREFEKTFDEAGWTLDADANLENPDINDGAGDESDWFNKLMNTEDNDGCDISFAELNRKRKKLTFEAFQDPAFLDKIQILQCLVQPSIECMHSLFKRTGDLAKLSYLPQEATEKKKLQKELLARPPVHIFGRTRTNYYSTSTTFDSIHTTRLTGLTILTNENLATTYHIESYRTNSSSS